MPIDIDTRAIKAYMDEVLGSLHLGPGDFQETLLPDDSVVVGAWLAALGQRRLEVGSPDETWREQHYLAYGAKHIDTWPVPGNDPQLVDSVYGRVSPQSKLQLTEREDDTFKYLALTHGSFNPPRPGVYLIDLSQKIGRTRVSKDRWFCILPGSVILKIEIGDDGALTDRLIVPPEAFRAQGLRLEDFGCDVVPASGRLRGTHKGKAFTYRHMMSLAGNAFHFHSAAAAFFVAFMTSLWAAGRARAIAQPIATPAAPAPHPSRHGKVELLAATADCYRATCFCHRGCVRMRRQASSIPESAVHYLERWLEAAPEFSDGQQHMEFSPSTCDA